MKHALAWAALREWFYQNWEGSDPISARIFVDKLIELEEQYE